MKSSAWIRLAALSVAVLFTGFGAYEIYDFDVPLHLITGEYLIKDVAAAGENVFSFTNPGYAWVNDKWLENVLIYLVDAISGAAGLVLFRIGLVLALGWMVWKAMQTGPGGPALRLAILSLVPWVAYERFNLRPELFSLVLVPLMVWFVARDKPGPRDWILVAALHAVWVNLHGYWIVGPLVLIAFLAGDAVESWFGKHGWPSEANPPAALGRLRHRGTLLLAALGGAFISPYPLQLFLNPFRVLGFLGQEDSAMGTIAELRSPFDPRSVFNWALPFFCVAALVALICLLLNMRRAHPSHWFLFVGFFLMAARNRRNIGMFAIVGAIVAVWSLGSFLAVRLQGKSHAASRWKWAPVLPLVVIAANALGSWFVLTDRFYIADITSRRTGFGMSRLTYPTGLADFIEQTRPPLRFFNDFVSGNYLAYRLAPEYKVYITGNTFKYPLEFFNTYSRLTLGGDEYKKATEQYDLNAFAIQYRAADMMPMAQRLFNDSEWVAVYFDDNSILFVRDVPALRDYIAEHQVDFGRVASERQVEGPSQTRYAGLAGLLGRVPYPRGELNRATLMHRVGQYDLAEVDYRRALVVYPELRDVEHALADAILEMGRYQEAADIYAKLLAARPGFWDRIRLTFDALRQAPESSDEPHLYRDIFLARSGMGTEHAGQQDWAAARTDLEAGLDALERGKELDPRGDRMAAREANTRFNLGTTLWKMSLARGGDPTLDGQAETQFQAARALQPGDPGLLYRLARTRARQGRVDEALALLETAVSLGGREYAEAALGDEAMELLRTDARFQRILSSTPGASPAG